MIQLTPAMIGWLDHVETTPYWTNADLGMLNIAVDDAADRYGVTRLQLALVFIDLSVKMHHVVQGDQYSLPLDAEIAQLMTGQWEPPAPDDDDHKCDIGMRAATFGVQMALMAAIATREERGKPPVWQSHE